MSSQPTEDYIKGVYKLQKNGKSVSTSKLAEHLGLADASVTDMVKKLSAKKLLTHTPYRGVGLTEEGRRLAMKMMRRHRLWEMFLTKFLGYTWDAVHDEAERLEHVTSDEMEHRLDKALGYPKLDPHGDPIPTADGVVHAQALTALSEVKEGDCVKVLRVSDDDAALLQHAARLGLVLHQKLLIKEKLLFDGSMKVKIGKKEHFISRQLADAIFVHAV
ncbi:MAG TPA: metal-dependent transcriptional regulator [Bacteroidota bacterium]|jgi:DtxR family Mn-dependent transcriptional regulator|nr:metal-dependent transcriptional regulator [Bacteroidota bacterium]